MKNKYDKQVELICPTCGGTQFGRLNSGTVEPLLQCAGCQRTLSSQELQDANTENISAHSAQLLKEVQKDVVKDLRDTLRNAFKGNKNIRFK